VNRTVVSDTGPLLHLGEAGFLDLVHKTGTVLIPPVVSAEWKKHTGVRKQPGWLVVRSLEEPFVDRSQSWVDAEHLDAGEAQAIALVLQEKADWLLTDDAQARQLAEGLKIEVHGSIGVLLWAAVSGYFENRSQAQQVLEALARSSLWVSEWVLREAYKAIDAIYSEE
jgi:predicted nucleic acid-binding protein